MDFSDSDDELVLAQIQSGERDVLGFDGTPRQLETQRQIENMAVDMYPYVEELIDSYAEWSSNRYASIHLMTRSISTIDTYHNNGKIATVTGQGINLAGDLLMIGGLLAMPFTGGASAILVASSLTMNAIGEATVQGTKWEVKQLINKEMKKAEKLLEIDEE